MTRQGGVLGAAGRVLKGALRSIRGGLVALGFMSGFVPPQPPGSVSGADTDPPSRADADPPSRADGDPSSVAEENHRSGADEDQGETDGTARVRDGAGPWPRRPTSACADPLTAFPEYPGLGAPLSPREEELWAAIVRRFDGSG
ncbi:hypothetical protein GCM10023195_51950 [Actinoallomurus liliacearum]|uniref:Uncharacterized protein n=1 Tax=Actinoallomurus liliacearum TaxID=1080073 RepID=A0ABP8TMS4_9ACTN